jgi:hypothetical protein
MQEQVGLRTKAAWALLRHMRDYYLGHDLDVTVKSLS